MTKRASELGMILSIFALAFALTFVSPDDSANTWRVIWFFLCSFSVSFYFRLEF